MAHPDPHGSPGTTDRPDPDRHPARPGAAALDAYPPGAAYRSRPGAPDVGVPTGPWPPPAPSADRSPPVASADRSPSAAAVDRLPQVSAEPLPERPRRPGPGRRRAPRGRRGREAAARSRGRPSRAGRNLPAAIGVGVGLAALVLAPLFLWRPGFLLVVGVAVAVATWELAAAIRAGGARAPLPPLLAGGLGMVALAWFVGLDALALGLLVTVLACMVWRLADGPANYQQDVGAATLIAVYVPFLAGFGALLAAPPDGDLRVLATLAAVVLSDTGGYVAGVLLGRHKMAPSVSPGKSWEGFGGSVLASALGSALLLLLLFDVAWWRGALFGLALAAAAVLGDLAESLVKRDLGVKDMSRLLPGHGGLMDRLDSILFAVPVGYLLLSLFAPAAG
ncbi:MAG TPA: phosphatidate cytidylyltransferase [Pilimelia sp.]|nr:phosphatidate cytidylyltransferase [Pilimelia sp.]